MDDVSAVELAQWCRDLADVLEPPECTRPGYGVPGQDHCAACCYGAGYELTCIEDQRALDACRALRAVADDLSRVLA